MIKSYTNLEKVGSIMLAFYLDEFDTTTSKYGGFLGFNFIKHRPKIRGEDVKKLDGIEVAYPIGFAFFIKKEVWEQVGGYDEHLTFGGDDNDLGIRLILYGYKNYLYSKTLQRHIGMPERTDNTKYCYKYKEMLYAQLYTIVKNYSFSNLLITLCVYSMFSFFKSFKQSLYRRNSGPFFAFLKGYWKFLNNLPIGLRKRKVIQRGRLEKKDLYLYISPPKSFS